jgi:hypothetical protein
MQSFPLERLLFPSCYATMSLSSLSLYFKLQRVNNDTRVLLRVTSIFENPVLVRKLSSLKEGCSHRKDPSLHPYEACSLQYITPFQIDACLYLFIRNYTYLSTDSLDFIGRPNRGKASLRGKQCQETYQASRKPGRAASPLDKSHS